MKDHESPSDLLEAFLIARKAMEIAQRTRRTHPRSMWAVAHDASGGWYLEERLLTKENDLGAVVSSEDLAPLILRGLDLPETSSGADG